MDRLKKFVTITMVALLFVVVIANLLGATLEQSVLLLVTNVITMVFTYYFSKTIQSKDNSISSVSNVSNTTRCNKYN